jgi:hypothetical protein
MYVSTFNLMTLFKNSLHSPPQAIKDQVERDVQLVGLVKAMENVYSFIKASDSFHNKVQLFQKIIDIILKQTVECATLQSSSVSIQAIDLEVSSTY